MDDPSNAPGPDRQDQVPTPSSSSGAVEQVYEAGSGTKPRRITLRLLSSRSDFEQCVALQRAVFGPPVIASAVLMKSSAEVGGLAAGAFADDGEMLGSMFSISGVRHGRMAHWVSFTAVAPGAHGLGIGPRIQGYLREFYLDLGFETAFWTIDPLIARVAHFNLNRLGSRPIEYVRSFYGECSSNETLSELDHDRFVVRWPLREPRVERALAGEPPAVAGWRSAPVINSGDDGKPLAGDLEIPEAPILRVEIPLDIRICGRDRPQEAVAWRRSARHVFEQTLAIGYRFRGFVRHQERCFYVLGRAS